MNPQGQGLCLASSTLFSDRSCTHCGQRQLKSLTKATTEDYYYITILCINQFSAFLLEMRKARLREVKRKGHTPIYCKIQTQTLIPTPSLGFLPVHITLHSLGRLLISSQPHFIHSFFSATVTNTIHPS